MQNKSSVKEIRERFDNDVERFSNLETGQAAAMDAPIALQLIAQAARAVTPHAKSLLDVGCGAGNFSLRLLAETPTLESVTLIDLSDPMLRRAEERIQANHSVQLDLLQADIRDAELEPQAFDVVVAAAVLHHLRTEDEWRQTFSKIFQATRPGGSFWIFDMVCSSIGRIDKLQMARYGEYLVQLKDEAYRDHVFGYIEKEDTPQSLMFQVELLQQVGFTCVELLHFNTRFAAFGGVRTV